MVSSSKILTVSYGTFSCTVEGFDDPLEVVKETTQFFRGVVGEDRFFGAEPPQFDPELATEMMRERLSSDLGQGTLTLGRAPGAPVVDQSLSTADLSTSDLLPDDDTIEATAILTERLTDAENVATDIPSVSAPDTASAPMPTPDPIDSAPIGTETEAEGAPALRTSAPKNLTTEDLTAKLDRIRSVVAKPEQEEQAETPEPETTPEANLLQAVGAAVETVPPVEEEPAQDTTDALSADAFEFGTDVAVSKDEPASEPEIDLEALQETLTASDDVIETADVSEPAQAQDNLDDLDDAALDALLNDLKQDTSAQEAPAQVEETLSPEVVAEVPAAAEPAPAPVAPKAKPKVKAKAIEPRRPRARVVKVKRATFEKALEKGQYEEIIDTPAPAPKPEPKPEPAVESSLSREDEDDLARELAAVKAELEQEYRDDALAEAEEAKAAPLRLDEPLNLEGLEADIDAEVRNSARKAVKMASPARAMLTEQSVEDDATSRLLDQADNEMDEPEGNRRRTAIAHLRAAVAATKADRLLGRKDTAEEEEPYREDLANVVRPRRPQGGAAAAAAVERPAEISRPAPLKLVEEDRIGQETSAPAPVRPRRVQRIAQAVPTPRTATPEPDVARNIMDSAEGFIDYVAQTGATELPDMLEAAAAYMTFVEERPHFSRPQLMTLVREAEEVETAREDRLRNFGRLLREGKIVKTAGGRFAASDSISFKP